MAEERNFRKVRRCMCMTVVVGTAPLIISSAMPAARDAVLDADPVQWSPGG